MIVDQILFQNSGTWLAYTGDVDGKYIQVLGNSNRVDFGEYHGGMPYITDACFASHCSIEYATHDEALQRAIASSGREGLLSWLFQLPNGFRTPNGGLIHAASCTTQ